MKVELGAGARAHDGFLAVDLNPTHADVLADALHLPFATGSVDALRAVDVLEHISYRHTDAALSEWRRVCVRSAQVYIQVPDAGTIMTWYAHRDERLGHFDLGVCSLLEGATWRLLGGHNDGKYVAEDDDWRWNAHYSLWDRHALAVALGRAGFADWSIDVNAHPNLLCHAWAA